MVRGERRSGRVRSCKDNEIARGGPSRSPAASRMQDITRRLYVQGCHPHILIFCRISSSTAQHSTAASTAGGIVWKRIVCSKLSPDIGLPQETPSSHGYALIYRRPSVS